MYEDFAGVYDSLTGDVDYKKRADYLKTLFKRFDRMPTLLLDLACGTGGFSNEFAGDGVSVIGVDISPEMLNVAKEKSDKQKLDVLYLCQSASKLDLYGTVDGAICCLDSLNHITDYEELKESFERVSLFLERDRLFIFDVNTEYKHREILGNNTFVIEDENIYCVWQNECQDGKTVDMCLDFFKENKNGLYERSQEFITERAYSEEELGYALENSGFEVLSVYGENSFEKPQKDTQRAVYIARKVK